MRKIDTCTFDEFAYIILGAPYEDKTHSYTIDYIKLAKWCFTDVDGTNWDYVKLNKNDLEHIEDSFDDLILTKIEAGELSDEFLVLK